MTARTNGRQYFLLSESHKDDVAERGAPRCEFKGFPDATSKR